MADEARCRKEQQLSLSIHYVDNKLTPTEHFLMFKDCSNKWTVEELSGLVTSALKDLTNNEVPVVPQTSNEANVMSAQYGVLQIKIRENWIFAN